MEESFSTEDRLADISSRHKMGFATRSSYEKDFGVDPDFAVDKPGLGGSSLCDEDVIGVLIGSDFQACHAARFAVAREKLCKDQR